MSEERFDAVQDHPDYEAAMTHEPPVKSVLFVVASAVMLAFSVAFAVVSIALLLGSGAPFFFQVVWAAGAGAFVLLGCWLVLKAWQFHRAPVRRFVALVVGTRTDVSSSSGNNPSINTTYYVTLQDRGGARAELRAPGPVVGQLTANDIGVAYRKAGTLIDFRRFAA